MTAGTRLAAAAGRLTVFERAKLLLRADLSAEELSTETKQLLKPNDPEVARITDAVFDANAEFWHSCAFTVEWLYQEEIQVGWLRCLDGMLERDATLRAALASAGWSVSEGERSDVRGKAKAVVLTALPDPGHGLARTLPLLWGVKAFPDEDETPPAELVGLRAHLAFEARRSLELRWRDLLATRAVLAELSAVFGESMVHQQLAGILDTLEAKVLELYDELCRRGERFPLPGCDEERLAAYRGWVRWDDLREPGEAATTRAGWVPPHLQQQLDELEARLVAEARGNQAAIEAGRTPE